jgi:hypothetical protein
VKNAVLLTFLIALVFIFPKKVRAALDFEDPTFPEFVTSARALAMGNAYICKVDDSMSAFYNPAGLGTVRKPTFHLANIHLEGSSGLAKVLAPGAVYEGFGNFIKSFDAENMRDLLAENQGELAHSRFNLFPNFTVRGLTIGYFLSQRNRSIINDDVDNKFEVLERRDHGPVFSLSGSLFGGILKLGASATYIIRRDLDLEFGPSDPISISDSDYKNGKSLQITAGSRLTLPLAMLPTFSAVLRNATANDWDGATGPDNGPDVIKQTLDVGFSITPQIGKISRLHMEVNLKDLSNSYDTDVKRRIASGMEIDFRRRLFIRAGYGDGWGSGGLGVRTRTFNLDLTTYAVDRSLDGFREQEDRRWVLSLSSGF